MNARLKNRIQINDVVNTTSRGIRPSIALTSRLEDNEIAQWDDQSLSDEDWVAKYVCFFSISLYCNAVMLMNKCWCCMILSYEEFSVLFFKRSVRRGKKKALLTQSLLELWISVVAPVNQFTYFPHCHLGTMWIEIWGISTRHLITHLSQGWKKEHTA